MKIFIFLNGKKNHFIGGRCGYVANLFIGIEKTGLSDKFSLLENVSRPTWLEVVGKMFSKFILGSNARKKFRRRWNLRFLGVRKTILGNLSHEVGRILQKNGRKDDIIVCNSVTEFALVRDFLLRSRLSLRMVLISHHPCAPHIEIFESYERDCSLGLLSKKDAASKKEEFLNIERDAFRHADFLLFPSREAMEPYFSTWKEFSDLISGKKILFVETGVAEKQKSNMPKSALEKKLGLSASRKFRICFLGRHNSIKGYDLLIKAAEILAAKKAEVEFVIGGNREDGYCPPSLPTWKEVGYVNPPEVFAVSDLFVLPNRETYFDLVLLEALSFGIPILASRTGGNKTVAYYSDGISLFDNDESGRNLAEAILFAANASRTSMIRSGERNRATYCRRYTECAFAKRFYKTLKLIDNETV